MLMFISGFFCMDYAGASMFSVEHVLIGGVAPWYRLNRSLNHLL
jgi:hypothetical protein